MALGKYKDQVSYRMIHEWVYVFDFCPFASEHLRFDARRCYFEPGPFLEDLGGSLGAPSSVLHLEHFND